MLQYGCYNFVRDIAIDALGYQIDYFDPFGRMTLLHTIAKHRTSEWDKEEIKQISWFISKSNNILITNNFGSNPLRTCKHCNQAKNFNVF